MFSVPTYRGFYSIDYDNGARFFACSKHVEDGGAFVRQHWKDNDLAHDLNECRLVAMNNQAWMLINCNVAGEA